MTLLPFHRVTSLKKFFKKNYEKIGIIGGGVIGICIAIALQKNGFQVCVFDKGKCFSETSSKSSKLLHGGIRYLENFEFSLVLNALYERKKWLDDFPNEVNKIKKFIPIYSNQGRNGPYIYVGAKIYDFLSFGKSMGKSGFVSKKEFLKLFPEIKSKGLKHIVFYHDLLMNDLDISQKLLNECKELGVKIFEDSKVTFFSKSGFLSTKHKEYFFDQIINCAGPWSKSISKDFSYDFQFKLVRGSHLILNKHIKHPLLLQSYDDRRVVFLLPYEGKSILGTTECEVETPDENSISLIEKDYLIKCYNDYFDNKITNRDIINTYSGTRVIVDGSSSINALSREHTFYINDNVITVVGGKWTSSRSIADEVLKKVLKNAG